MSLQTPLFFLQRSRESLLNASHPSQPTERVSRLLALGGSGGKAVSAVGAGEIAALVGLRHTRSGDTLCEKAGDRPVALPGMDVPEPVFFCAWEPHSTSDEVSSNFF